MELLVDYKVLFDEFVDKLPAIFKEKGEIFKERIALMQDQVQWNKDKVSELETENLALRSQLIRLTEQLAYAGVTEEYVHEGVFFVKKGDPNKRCPSCRTVLSQKRNAYSCAKCKWHHEPPMEGPCIVVSPPDFPKADLFRLGY